MFALPHLITVLKIVSQYNTILCGPEDSDIEIRTLPGYVWLLGVLDRGPAGVSRRLCTVSKKKKKKKKKKRKEKTSRGKVLYLKILNLNRKAMMKYCWSLLITDLEDLADLKFYLLSLSISLKPS